MTTDPAATLQALAADFRKLGTGIGGPDDSPDARTWRALADHVDGVRRRHMLGYTTRGADVTELLAVAAAAGVKPSTPNLSNSDRPGRQP